MAMTSEGTAADAVADGAERELDAIEASLGAIEQAMSGFDDGTYGRCEVCGAPVEATRLALRASERRCAEHAAE